jgi:PAS domain S-box-containing protein
MSFPNFTVLMVEDFEADRELYRRSLDQESACLYELLEAESVAAGLELCRTRSIDAILLDYMLPDGDGLDFLAELSVQSNGTMPPVVMMTGQGNESTAARAIKLGAEDYWVKHDLTPELLQIKVRKLIENARQQQQELIAQKKQAELSLQTANRQIMTIWESMTDAYVTLDRDWRIIYTNPAATEICRQTTGLGPTEYLGKTHWELFPWTLGTIAEREYRRAVAEQVTVNFEIFYEPTETWFEIHGYPSKEGFGVYFRDISQRKITQLNDKFIYELTQRLRQLTDAESIQWETVKSLGEYLNVDRATWFEVDAAQEFATIERDWYREGLTSHAGVYAIADFQAAQSGGSLVAVSDVTTDPFTAPRIASYQRVGLGAFVNVPCIEAGRWVATLNVNTTTVRIWRDDEIELLKSVVTQLWSLVTQARGVQALRAQEQQTRAAQAIVEQQLREIESIYQTAPVGLCFVDTDLRFVRLNEKLAEINGLPVAAHIGRTLREVLPTADTLEPLYRQVIESGEPIVDLELSGTSPTQPDIMVYCLVSYYPQKDAQGRVVGVNAMVQDISCRKRQEAQIQQAQATIYQQLSEIESIYQTAPVGLCFLDTDLRFVRINERLAEINSLPAAAHIGRTMREVLPEIADQLEPLYRQVIESGESILDREISCSLSSQPGVMRDWLLCYYPQKDAEGRVLGISAIVQEITDRKRHEAALEARNQELDAFVFVVSHDLKAPLRAVANLSQWIEEDLEEKLTADTQMQMNLLRSRVNRMSATIDGLLEYARVGRSEDEIESVALGCLLADVVDEVAPPPAFTIDLPENLPTLSAKRLLLFQIFVNLVGNGIKHHHSETGSIKISIEDRGDCYEFAIADDGPGIALEHQERMFQIFQAVNPQNRSDSTGIGLAIVKKIVEAEGGTLWLESEIGHGTTFYFTWPKCSGRRATS